MVRDYSPLTQPDQAHNFPPLQSGDRLTRPQFEHCHTYSRFALGYFRSKAKGK